MIQIFPQNGNSDLKKKAFTNILNYADMIKKRQLKFIMPGIIYQLEKKNHTDIWNWKLHVTAEQRQWLDVHLFKKNKT